MPSYDDYVSLKKFMVEGINAVNNIRELEAENAKLKKQVAIAVKALDSLRGICYPQVAEKAFKQIKELDK